MVLLDRQNFRFKPRRAFDPVGRVLSLQRLWNARFLGCRYCGGFSSFFNVLLKFFCKVSCGEAQKPKVVRHLDFVCANCVLTVWWFAVNSSRVFSDFMASRLYLRCSIRRDVLPSFCLHGSLECLGMFQTGWGTLKGWVGCVLGCEIARGRGCCLE
jgi:hypothetical protein